MKLIKSLGVFLAIMSFVQTVVLADDAPFKPGEIVIYDVRKLKLKVGEVKLVYEGPLKYNNQEMLLINFTAKGANFSDVEKIYLDPTTFLPLIVERDVNVFGSKEKIVEKYDLKEGKVVISKTVRNKTTEQVIDKDGALENIYGFLYRYRMSGKFNASEKSFMRLPTKDVTMKYKGTEMVEVGGKKRMTHFLESDPAQYQIWFDSSVNRIPVRINGAAGFGKTSMVLKSYQP